MLDVVDSIKERCLQWIGRERKLTLILNTNPTLTLILNTNPKIDWPGCKYLANENVWIKQTPVIVVTGVFH